MLRGMAYGSCWQWQHFADLHKPALQWQTCKLLSFLAHQCRGDFGRLGHGDCNDIFIPQSISALSGRNIVKIACGDTHTLAVTDAGDLFAFGRNQNGQLGIGSTNDALLPHPVEALKVRFTASSMHVPDSVMGWTHFSMTGPGMTIVTCISSCLDEPHHVTTCL